MHVKQHQFTLDTGWQQDAPGGALSDAQFVLVFGHTGLLSPAMLRDVSQTYPEAVIMGCSTAGEIKGTTVSDDSICVTAVGLSEARVQGAYVELDEAVNSYEAGKKLARQLDPAGLSHIFVLSDGLTSTAATSSAVSPRRRRPARA